MERLVTDDLAAQVAALETGVAVVDRSWAEALEISGADRRRFLNGRVSQDLAAAEDGGGLYGFVTDRKGRVVSDFALSAIGDQRDGHYLLELPAGRAEAVDGMLAPYVLADRVEIARRDDLALLAVAGPEAEELLGQLTGATPPADDWAHAETEIAGIPVRLVRRPLAFEAPCWTVWVAKDRVVELTEALVADGGAGATPVSHQAAEIARVAAGLPRWGADFDHGHLPQETGLEDYAVSYTKGCYLGQEVVARIHYRGGVQKQMTALRFEGAGDDGDDGPAPGADLSHEERSVGQVGSVVRHPERGLLGLAVVHRRGRDAGSVAVEGGGRAEVVDGHRDVTRET